MSVLRTLKKLVLGETWLLPAGLALILGGSAVLRSLVGDSWQDFGGFALLAGAATVLVASVVSTARPRN
jgi:membrane protein implicated in regulation of membrane protease activity